jgi:hypothetical protein
MRRRWTAQRRQERAKSQSNSTVEGVLSLMRVLFPLGKCARGWGRRTIADARALFPAATLCRRIVPTGIIEDCAEAACINAGAKRGRHLGRAIGCA